MFRRVGAQKTRACIIFPSATEFECLVDCSQSPCFSVGLSRLVRFDGAVAILVCKRERNLGRLSELPRGAGWGLVEWERGRENRSETLPFCRHNGFHDWI